MDDFWKIRRILFATDFLESSRLALDYAVALSVQFRATLVMLHALELSSEAQEAEAKRGRPSVSRQLAQERLDALAHGVQRAGIVVESHIIDGIPCDTILESVKTLSADLLVIGTHGVHKGLEHLLIGSNTERILLSSTCPTLTVGAHVLAGVDLGFRPKEILYFSDFTPEAAAAAPYALQLGRDFGVPVDLCQVVPEFADGSDTVKQKLANDYCREVEKLLGPDRPKWCDPPFQLTRGQELDQLIARAESQPAGLIVLGVRMQSGLRLHLHTSLAYHLLARASCPVLTIRQDAACQNNGGERSASDTLAAHPVEKR